MKKRKKWYSRFSAILQPLKNGGGNVEIKEKTELKRRAGG